MIFHDHKGPYKGEVRRGGQRWTHDNRSRNCVHVFSQGMLVNYRAIGMNSLLESLKGINPVTSGL